MVKRYYAGLDGAGASGTPCYFDASTNVTGNSSFAQETENIVGAAGADVLVQVTLYTVTNPTGKVLVNASQVFLNNTFTITLDGSGNGSFVARVEGSASATGTIVRAVFQLMNVTIGQLGTPKVKQISKVF
jgi:phage gp45-like